MLLSFLKSGSVFLLLMVLGCSPMRHATQHSAPPPFASIQAFKDSVRALAAWPDEVERTEYLEALWDSLVVNQQAPLVIGDSVAFLYRGKADSVLWFGNFNSNGRLTHVPNRGIRIGTSDIWILEHQFPLDARIEYWLTVDGQNRWDDANPRRIPRGPNVFISELGMPAWKPSPWIERLPDVSEGNIERYVFDSAEMDYEIQYWVYTPPGHSDTRGMPTLYITDGAWYLSEHSGNLPAVLDNLIAHKKMRPIVAVFIDARDPDNPSFNRREAEFKMNPRYARFVAEELVPTIDERYKTSTKPQERGIMGLSFGGLNAAYFGVACTDTFRKVAMQSPALHGNGNIYMAYTTNEIPFDQQLYITTGTINDTEIQTDQFIDILDLREIPYEYVKVSDGHSMGAWRHQFADILTYFW